MPESPYIPDLERDLRVAAARMDVISKPGRRFRLAASAVTAVAAATVAALIAFFAGAGSDPRATASPVRADGVVLGDIFSVFRAPGPADTSGSPFSERRGLVTVDPASARQLAIQGSEVWVAADRHQVCIAGRRAVGAPGFGGACARPAQILDRGLFATSQPSPTDVAAAGLPSGTTQIVGLLPDGVTSVTFSLADGRRVAESVVNNGVALTVSSEPSKVAFRDANNVLHTGSL